MKFFSDFLTGLVSYFRAIAFIAKHKLWLYFMLPLMISLLLLWGGKSLESNLARYDLGNPETIRSLIWEMVKMLLLSTLAFVSVEMRKYIVLTVLSPLLNRLSIQTEQIIIGHSYDTTWKQFVSDLRRAIRIISGNFIIQYALSLAWLILSIIIQPLQSFTPMALLAIGFYFYGFGMIDYVNERRRLNIDESVSFVRNHAGFAIGIGAVFSLMFLIPYEIGVTIAPILAIVATTLGMHQLVDLSKNKYARKD
jgi:CysZ protein